MNSIPVLKSKLIMPELSECFLLTERLKKLHKSMDSCRAVAICAPAGYGKTTLAVSYFCFQAARPFRVCWYRPDCEDENLSVFMAHLSEALFPKETTEFVKSEDVMQTHTDTQQRRFYPISMLCRKMWTEYNKDCNTRTYIVLDDFQNVGQSQDICDITRYMIDNLPPSYNLFILNRSSQPVITEKQKLEIKVLEIGADDLAFSDTEIEDFIHSMGHTASDRFLTGMIQKNTEGWVAGIIILYQAVKSKGSVAASIELGKLHQEEALFRYMSMEVFESVEEDTQEALARLALLQDFSEGEASEILEVDDIKTLLVRCMGFGMFIQKIPGEPVVYRFHSLFREFLLYHLKDRCPALKVAEIHLKAAGYYMRNGIYGRAAEHLTKCSNSAAATDMVTKAGFNKFMIGETGQLKLWLDKLPEEMVRDNPVLLMFKAQLMPNSRQPEMVDALKRVLLLSLQDNNLALYYDAASVLIYIFMCGNDMKGLVEMTQGLPELPRNVSAELENTLVVLDMVNSIGKDRFSTAAAQSESVLYDLLPEDSKWLYLILSCITYYCLGKLDQGERCMKTALELSRFKNIEPSRGFILLFLSIILMLKNERDSLASNITEIIEIGEKYKYEYLSAHAYRLAAFESYLSHDTEAAAEKLYLAIHFFSRINNKGMAAACRLLMCFWKIQPDSPAPDMDDAGRDIELIRSANPGMMVYESSLSVFGAIAAQSGDYSLAERSLLSVIKSAKAKKGVQILCGALFHIARLYYITGDTRQGKLYLKQAMEIAASNRYFMFWDIHLSTLVEMALRSIRYGYCIGYAEELLRRFYDSRTVRYLTERVKCTDESRIEAFVNGFIFTYKADSSQQLYFVKASLLGKTEISVNGIKIPDTEWKTKKVKGFLEFLLFNSGNTVSKDTLAETFWSGSNGKSAIASQRTALYHLRKILSKYDAQVMGNQAFIFEASEGLQIRKNDTLELDVHEFLSLYNELTRIADNDEQTRQKETDILERMLIVYKGDLMEGSDYSELVFDEQERLKSIYMEACQKLSSIRIKNGELVQAEEILRLALAKDPYNENICLDLLKLYKLQGRRGKAVKLYYSFRKRFEQEIEMKIDKRLTEVIRSLKLEK